MTIQFMRPAPYNYKLKGHSLYESYDLVAKDLLRTDIDQKVIDTLRPIKTPVNVVSSPLSRAQNTAALFSKAYTTINELREFAYGMSDLMTPQEFGRLGAEATTEARKRFFIALFANQLSESLDDVQKRIELLFEKLSAFNEDILAISHSFFMKYLEVYIRDKQATCDFKKFQQYYDGSTTAFDFMGGFTVNCANK